MSRVTRMKEACHTYDGVMSHIWMSHVPLSYMSRYPQERHISRGYLHIYTCVSIHEKYVFLLDTWSGYFYSRGEICIPTLVDTYTCIREYIRSGTSQINMKCIYVYTQISINRWWWRHVTHTKKACHTYWYVVSPIWMSHVPYPHTCIDI